MIVLSFSIISFGAFVGLSSLKKKLPREVFLIIPWTDLKSFLAWAGPFPVESSLLMIEPYAHFTIFKDIKNTFKLQL